MKTIEISLAIVFLFVHSVVIAEESTEAWYAKGQQELQTALSLSPNLNQARNIILFIGDGMGISTTTAARIFAGQLQGMSGEENVLAYEKLPYVALSKTYNTNQQTPDSAGTMTAMITGVKTKAGLISVSAKALRGDCASASNATLPTFLEQAEKVGMATGIVTTARLTHATPAAAYAHVPERDWEADSEMPDSAIQEGCLDIARQFVEFRYGDGVEVALGGGRQFFLPRTEPDPEYPQRTGKRRDDRNLIEEWKKKFNGTYVWNREQFDAVDSNETSYLLGLFEPSHMRYETDRAADKSGEPSLSRMTDKAIRILSGNRNGYFLIVEGGRIDHAHHANNAYRALDDTREFANAVQVAMETTKIKDTLIIVTADHSHVLTIAGYPTRGNPILGKVVGNDDAGNPRAEPVLDAEGKPYTTLGYQNGPGFAVDIGGDRRRYLPADNSRHDLSKIDTEDKNYHQEAFVPVYGIDKEGRKKLGETHGGEDVVIYARGPWAHLFHGTHEQNYIYHVMRHASVVSRK